MESFDEQFLRLAIALAHHARQQDADPFGAVLAKDGVVLHQAYDRSVELSDPTFHAELSVISEYCRAQRQFSLHGYTLDSFASGILRFAPYAYRLAFDSRPFPRALE